jgi:hypothetical protein
MSDDFWRKRWTQVVTDERKGRKESLREKTNEEVVDELELAIVLINSVAKAIKAGESDEEVAKYLNGARKVILGLMGEK